MVGGKVWFEVDACLEPGAIRALMGTSRRVIHSESVVYGRNGFYRLAEVIAKFGSLISASSSGHFRFRRAPLFTEHPQLVRASEMTTKATKTGDVVVFGPLAR